MSHPPEAHSHLEVSLDLEKTGEASKREAGKPPS